MKKITIEEKKNVTGLVELASAAEYINNGIYGYLLETEEEIANACPNNVLTSTCFTCTIHNEQGCNRYEFLRNGVVSHL